MITCDRCGAGDKQNRANVHKTVVPYMLPRYVPDTPEKPCTIITCYETVDLCEKCVDTFIGMAKEFAKRLPNTK